MELSELKEARNQGIDDQVWALIQCRTTGAAIVETHPLDLQPAVMQAVHLK